MNTAGDVLSASQLFQSPDVGNTGPILGIIERSSEQLVEE